MCSSTQLFAACHVFLRLLVPRHPPCALTACPASAIHLAINKWSLKSLLNSFLRKEKTSSFDVFSYLILCIQFSRSDTSLFANVRLLRNLTPRHSPHVFASFCTFGCKHPQCKICSDAWLTASRGLRQPPGLPRRLQRSTFGRLRLNRRVRDGNGCDPQTHCHRKHSVSLTPKQ